MKSVYLFKDLNNKNGVIVDASWGRELNKFHSKIHSISSYLAMFCPALPEYFIKKYSNEKDLIMDNFSGRGTTALVSREMSRRFVGNDLNPYSIVLTRMKISKLNLEQLLQIIDSMEQEYLVSNYYKLKMQDNKYDELLNYYSEETLKQLIFIREKYGKKWKKNNKNINAILAFALGLMHGPMKKDNSTIYFSLDMPNTISMSPNYVKKYKEKNNLIAPNVNVFNQIRDRMKNKFDDLLTKNYDGNVFCHDSTEINKKIKNNSVDLVITSPPYLGIVNYTNSNWLKLWLLGYERSELKNEIKLSDSLKLDEYINFIKKYLNSIHSKLKKGSKVCLIVGDVFEKKLIEEVWNKIKNSVKYKFVEIYYDYKYTQTHKSTNLLNKKKGNATIIEKVLVIEKE